MKYETTEPGFLPPEPHMLAVVKPVGKDVDRAEDEFNAHRALGHLDDNDKVETVADYERTKTEVIKKLLSGSYHAVKVFGGDGTLNVVINAVKHLADKLPSGTLASSIPSIIAGDYGTVGDGRKSTHGHHFMDDLDIANKPTVPFFPMDMEIWDGDELALQRSVALYCGLNYTARVGEAADTQKWRRVVRAFPHLGKTWSIPVQALMAAAQLPGTPEAVFRDRVTGENFTAYDLSLLNGDRLGGQNVGVGDLRSRSFLELRVPSKSAVLRQAGRLAVHNFTPLEAPLKNTRSVSQVDYEVLYVEKGELAVHYDGQPARMRRGGRFTCKSSDVCLQLVAPMLSPTGSSQAA